MSGHQMDNDDMEDHFENEGDMHGYFSPAGMSCSQLHMKKIEEKNCYPNQACLTDIHIKRFAYSLLAKQGKKIEEDYDTFDFQVRVVTLLTRLKIKF